MPSLPFAFHLRTRLCAAGDTTSVRRGALSTIDAARETKFGVMRPTGNG